VLYGNPSDVTSVSMSVDELLRRARDARRRGFADEERRLLDEGLRIAPADASLLNAHGLRALADNDFEPAAAAFANAVAADPGQPALLLNLAAAHRGRKDHEAEREALQAALDLDQLQLTGQLRMAELLERQGRLSEAAKHWSAVVQIGSNATSPSPNIHEAVRRGQIFLNDHHRAFAGELEAEMTDVDTGGPDGRRFRACVDHMLGRRQIYRNECAGVHFPFLPADEFFDRVQFPWFAELEARTLQIRDEALALVASAKPDELRPYVRLDPGTPQNKWSPLDGSLDWGAAFLWEYGVRNDALCARCPVTAAALDAAPQSRIPGKAPSAFFSILKPGARIPPHTGVSNTRAIIHLPLVVPPGCGFRVGGETREWVEGQAFAFDDTIEHEAWNGSDQPRIVLILDVWNPHLSADERTWLTKLFAVADRGIVASNS
jgi:aspartate beta-hydroxylase